jgi:hypothetical protein
MRNTEIIDQLAVKFLAVIVSVGIAAWLNLAF